MVFSGPFRWLDQEAGLGTHEKPPLYAELLGRWGMGRLGQNALGGFLGA